MKFVKLILLMLAGLAMGGSHAFGADGLFHVYDFETNCVSSVSDLTEYSRYRVSNLTQSSKKTQTAAKSVQAVYDFYKNEFDWMSTDGQGMSVNLITNLAIKRRGDCVGINAGMFGNHTMAIYYGIKDSQIDIGSDIDTVGHEYTHGIFFSQGLLPPAPDHENAALNESIADIMGATIKAWESSERNFNNLRINSSTYKHSERSAELEKLSGNTIYDDSIRDLGRPSKHNYPDHYDQINIGLDCHVSCAVPSLAFYLMAEGGKHPSINNGIQVEAIGLQKVAKIVFYVLEHKFPFTDMTDFANQAKKAARKMYGENSKEVEATHNGFAAVGILNGAFGAPPPPPEPEPTPPESEPQPTTTEQGFQLSGMFFVLVFTGMVAIFLFLVLKPRKENKENSIHIPAPTPQPTPPVPTPEPIPEPPSSGVAVELQIVGKTFSLTLDDEPITIGREVTDLPTKIIKLLQGDEMISREHCQLFYKEQTDELYIINLSSNGTTVKGDLLSGQGEKGKLPFTNKVDLQIGQTQLSIQKSKRFNKV